MWANHIVNWKFTALEVTMHSSSKLCRILQVADVHLIRVATRTWKCNWYCSSSSISSIVTVVHYSQELSRETFNHVGANGYLAINYTCNQTPDLWLLLKVFFYIKKLWQNFSWSSKLRFFAAKMSRICKLQVFKNSPKLTIFNQLLFTKNVNVECDFFCNFQTPCLFLILQGVKNQLIFWGQLANAVDADKIFKKLCLLDRLDNAWQTSKFCLF